jgi:hypothetical protein
MGSSFILIKRLIGLTALQVGSLLLYLLLFCFLFGFKFVKNPARQMEFINHFYVWTFVPAFFFNRRDELDSSVTAILNSLL